MLQKQLQLDGVSKQSCRGLNLALLWHSATDSLPVDAPWSKSVPPCLSVHQDEKNQMMTTNVWLKQVGLQIYESFGFPTTSTYFKGASRSNITACLVCLSAPHRSGTTTSFAGGRPTTTTWHPSGCRQSSYGCRISSSTTSKTDCLHATSSMSRQVTLWVAWLNPTRYHFAEEHWLRIIIIDNQFLWLELSGVSASLWKSFRQVWIGKF